MHRKRIIEPAWLAAVGLWGGALALAQVPEFTAFTSEGAVGWSYPTNGVGEYRLQTSTGLTPAAWVDVPEAILPTGDVMTVWVAMEATSQFYRVGAVSWGMAQEPAPDGMVLIPGGAFSMGDHVDGASASELPVHRVGVAPFYADRHEVSLATWNEVAAWATSGGRGYDFDGNANGRTNDPAQPVQGVSWYDCVKWCNARSEKEGRTPAYYTSAGRAGSDVYRSGHVDVKNDWVRWIEGYRLPTEAEWEKAARGGSNGRYPWGNTLAHSNANYNSESFDIYTYDESPTRGLHPDYTDNVGDLCTSPVGAFGPHGFGLCDAVGNVWEWCWDRYSESYYSVSPSSSPLGPDSGGDRVYRGGSWYDNAYYGRLSFRGTSAPDQMFFTHGFRSVLSAVER